jgi:hypothetical protein
MSAGARLAIVRLAFLVAALLLPPLPTAAVIIASGDGTGNKIAPADDFGFANVGTSGQSVVYLGRGWVITAHHVSLGPVKLAGARYEPVQGSRVRLKNLGKPGPSPDVALFRLQKPWPELPELRVAEVSPRIGEQVVLMGNGPARGDPIQHDSIDGWAWRAPSVLRWGTNRVEAVGEPVRVGAGTVTTAFAMTFSAPHGERYPTPHEAQVGVGDSGGAAFIKRDDTWELAGVLFAARGVDGQAKRTSLYGNLTFAADLAAYRGQILEIISRPAPPPPLDDSPAPPTRWLTITLLVALAVLGALAIRRTRRARD